MDHAVALVQAYLQANGYFTVTEYTVLATLADGGRQGGRAELNKGARPTLTFSSP